MSVINTNPYHRLRKICKGIDRDDLACNKLYQVSKRSESSRSSELSKIKMVKWTVAGVVLSSTLEYFRVTTYIAEIFDPIALSLGFTSDNLDDLMERISEAINY